MTSDNLGELWEEHIDGKISGNKRVSEARPGSSRRETKRRKRERDASNTQDAAGKSKKSISKQNGVERPQKKEKPDSRKAGKDTREESTLSTVPEGEMRLLPLSENPLLPPSPNLTPLQNSMRQKLISSRFRTLNETLYTTSSTSSYELFNQKPDLFTEYHEGFQRQVASWPENPIDGFVRWIQERGRAGARTGDRGSQQIRSGKLMKGKDNRFSNQKIVEQAHLNLKGVEPLPRNLQTGVCTIIDLGCGEAKLSQKLSSSPSPTPSTASLNLRIHSFDLAATSELVTAADIRSLPLQESSIDVAIFCLALMGTNWIEFVEEAYRVLRWKGECWISEVCSRFGRLKNTQVEHSVGKHIRGKSTRNTRGKMTRGNIADEDEEAEALGTAEETIAARQESTDVSSFVSVLERRGFGLQGEPDLSNKMFVRMRFIKALAPSRGKCVRKGPASLEKHKKFIERETDEAITVAEEASTLKPCVYKIR